MIQKISFTIRSGAALCIAFLSVTSNVLAFNPTATDAALIKNKLPVFSVTVPIGANDTAIRLPIRGTVATPSDTAHFGFTLFSDTSDVALAGAFGVVLSDAPIQDDQYYIAPGSQHTLRILMIGLPTPGAAPQQLRAQVTHFPVLLGAEQTNVPLNQHELSNYVTPKITVR